MSGKFSPFKESTNSNKCLIIGILLSICIGIGLSAEMPKEKPLTPLIPEIMAQGDSYTAIARGYNALITNPAGFARGDGSLTISTASVWMYARPDQLTDVISGVRDGQSDDRVKDILNTIKPQFTENGFGVGASGGIGFVGSGLGLGLIWTLDSFNRGETFPLGIEGTTNAEFNFIGGYAIPIHLSETTLSIGADVRVISRVRAPFGTTQMADIFNAVLNPPEEGDPDYDPEANVIKDSFYSVNAFNGFGFALDVGAMLEMGSIVLGLSMRDFFGTTIRYNTNEIGNIVDTYPGLPAESDDAVTDPQEYKLPMNVSLGASYHPNLRNIRFFVDPTIHLELDDVFARNAQESTFWTRLHIGAELRMFRILRLWAGLNQGYPTFGGGVHLLFVDVNAALFTREMGDFAGDKPSTGVSVEVAFRI